MLVRGALAAGLIAILALSPLLGDYFAATAVGTSAYAAPSDAPPNANKNTNDNSNNNKSSKNTNRNGHSNANQNANDNDDDAGRSVPSAPSAPRLVRPAPATCSTPGQDLLVTSDDGRVTVRIFGTMSRPIRMTVRLPLESGVTPAPPGPIVGGLLFQLIAEECPGTPIPVLPAEINLGARYADADATGLNEATFTIARLDTNTNQWRPVEKQVADPNGNHDSATITEMGYYVVYQR